MERLLSIGRAARVLEVSVPTLREWARRGVVTAHLDPKGWRYFAREDVERLREWRQPKAAQITEGSRSR